MDASNQIFLVMDGGSPVTAFTARYLRRRLDTFCNPLVYTFAGGFGPKIMAISAAPAE
jgi:hypothetical protein